MDVPCIFEDYVMSDGVTYYQGLVKDLVIKKDVKLNFIGGHKDGKSNDDVTRIKFQNSSMGKVPKGLIKSFPNLKVLAFVSSKLKKINRKDLREYQNIEKFLCESGNIESQYLSGDLFHDFKNLTWISFYKNSLEEIEPNILDGLDDLKVATFYHNPGLECYYSIYSAHNANHTLDEVKDELYEKFLNSDRQTIKSYLKKRSRPSDCGLLKDLKSFISNEDLKDFKVLIDDMKFHVHKLLLTIRCPTLAEVLRNNPDAENLKLNDIPAQIFSIILKFLYTDELPDDDDINYQQLFVAAHRLQIEELKKFASEKIAAQISQENASEIFNIGNKYENKELIEKSFKFIKEKYPGIELKDKWMTNPEKVGKIIEGHKKMMESIKLLNNEFKRLAEDSD